jgi:hypothetical protein
MTNGTQLWPGDKMRAFFRAHIQRETSLAAPDAEKLSDALTKAVNRMLVWDVPTVESSSTAPSSAKTRMRPPTPVAADSSVANDGATPPAFDPYAFSAMVVLAKTGKDGLMKRLADIKAVEHLKAFAEAQHLAVSPKLNRADDLRKAIVVATEQRLADRRAAAS